MPPVAALPQGNTGSGQEESHLCAGPLLPCPWIGLVHAATILPHFIMEERRPAAPAVCHPAILSWEWGALGVICFLALAVRLWLLPQVPGLWYDEAINGLDALGILRESGWPIFFDTNNHMREPLFMYLEVIGIAIGGTSAMALRAVSMAIGLITLPVVWLLAREFRGPLFALAVVALVAFLRWHVIFSCLAFRTILAPLFVAAAALFFLRLARTGSLRDAIFCGAALGLGAYTYLAFRLVPLFFLPPMVMLLVQRHRAGAAGALLRLYGAMVGTAFLLFLPLGINYMANPHHFTGRGGEVGYLREEGAAPLLARQARDVALMFSLRGDHVGKHNIPGPPRFFQTGWARPHETAELWALEGQFAEMDGRAPADPHGTGAPVFTLPMGLLFYLGLGVICLRARREPGALLVVCWVLVGSFASILSFGAPNMLRLLYLVPAVAICACTGMWAAGEFLARRGRWVAPAVLGAVVSLHLFSEARLLLLWPSHPMVVREFNPELAEVGEALRREADRLPILVHPAFDPPPPTLRFLADGYTFHTEPPAGAERWWELRTRPPFPPLDGAGQLLPGGRRHMIIHPAGITFADLVEVHPPPD